MQQLEAAIRDELGIDSTPPRRAELSDGDRRGRTRALLRRENRAAGEKQESGVTG